MAPAPPPPAPPGAPDDPARTAAEAATRAEVRIVDVHDQAGFTAVSALFDVVRGRPGEAGTVLGPEALTAIAHAGGQVSAAVRDGELVGATAGFLGRREDGVPHLHSHVTGVVDDVTADGIRAAIRWHQRAWCLARGIDEARWFLDPLVRQHVTFALVRLGAQTERYLEDVHGRRSDAREGGLSTDRLVVRWPLTSPRVVGAAAGRTASPDVDALRRSGAEVLLASLPDGSPHVTLTDAARRLVQIPADIDQLRVTDPDLALAWAAALRTTLAAALDAGARVSGATRDGWLVLTSGDRVTELRTDDRAPVG